MPQASLGVLADALGPINGYGFIVFIVVAAVLLWEAVIVLSVLIATLSIRKRQHARQTRV